MSRSSLNILIAFQFSWFFIHHTAAIASRCIQNGLNLWTCMKPIKALLLRKLIALIFEPKQEQLWKSEGTQLMSYFEMEKVKLLVSPEQQKHFPKRQNKSKNYIHLKLPSNVKLIMSKPKKTLNTRLWQYSHQTAFIIQFKFCLRYHSNNQSTNQDWAEQFHDQPHQFTLSESNIRAS
mgnify:CR=1 FL=1